jgi:hypothetical protein
VIEVRRSSYAGPWASTFGDYAALPPIRLSANGPGCVTWEIPVPPSLFSYDAEYDPDPEPFELSVKLLSGEGAVDYLDAAEEEDGAGAP